MASDLQMYSKKLAVEFVPDEILLLLECQCKELFEATYSSFFQFYNLKSGPMLVAMCWDFIPDEHTIREAKDKFGIRW